MPRDISGTRALPWAHYSRVTTVQWEEEEQGLREGGWVDILIRKQEALLKMYHHSPMGFWEIELSS